jgi:putative membrane protein
MNLKIIFQSWKGKVFIITVLHVVGLLGFLNYLPIEGFEKLTPFNLLISAFLMLSHHKGWNKTSIGFFVIIFLWGYFIELIGVKTEMIFGTYYYGESLGFKLFDIPLMIGVNWIILVYSTAAIAELFPFSKYLKVFIAAILMVALDYFIEPFAIKHDLWHWAQEVVPFQNYVGWFVTSVLMQLLFFNLHISKNNLVAVWLYVLQGLFFITLF